MELIGGIIGVIAVIWMLRDEERRNEEMRKNPPVKYIIEFKSKSKSIR